MNPDTRVSVHCYAGDGPHVREALEMYTHHQCPLTILSPEDSRVEIDGQDCRFGGLRQSAGQLSLDRQRRHMEILLEYPEHFFLMNDADSMCLSPNFPDYLYAEPNVLWSNLVYNPIPEQQVGYSAQYYPDGFPRLAFQPPYFMSRSVMARLLAVAEGVKANPVMPFIDHYMVQLAVRANVTFKAFPDGISYAISTHHGEMQRALVETRHKGAIFVHAVKTPTYWKPLVETHRKWRADFNAPVNSDRRSTDGVRPYPLLTARWNPDNTILSYSETIATAPRPQPPQPQPQPSPRSWSPRPHPLIGSRFRRGIKA
jgi:hypothetical protein